MVEELVELFPGPRGGVLRAKVVQDEKVGIPEGVEAIVVAAAGVRVKGGSQVIEQIRNHLEDDRPTRLPPEHLDCDSGGEVGLADTAPPVQEEPARRRLDEVERFLVRLDHAGDRRIESVERLVLERIQVREATQLFALTVRPLPHPALTREDAAEFWMTHREVATDKARILAHGTGGRLRFRRNGSPCDGDRDVLHDVADALHRSLVPVTPAPRPSVAHFSKMRCT